ncbi:hypothetical protein C4572_03315 [Candidatus Parcubacteria bacterium]|nr:MAG: hypothetical protein C4572_03315 [Candidatus Parcubacteria bacterium]
MAILIYTVIISSICLIAFISKGVYAARSISREKLVIELTGSKPIFHDVKLKVLFPLFSFVYVFFAPKIYKEFEIIVSKIRLMVLRTERLLLQLVHYIRGKREVKVGGYHPYWNSLTESKGKKEE